MNPEVQSIYLELVEPQKGIVWRRTLPHARVAPDAWSLLPSAVAAADVFVVRTVRYDGTEQLANRTPILQGFQARDGAPLWTVAPMDDAKDPSGRSFRVLDLTLLTRGDLVLAAFGQESAGDVPGNAIMLALDAHTGAWAGGGSHRSSGARRGKCFNGTCTLDPVPREGQVCGAAPTSPCFDANRCVQGDCAPVPKAAFHTDDSVPGNCMDVGCDGLGKPTMVPNDQDLPAEPAPNDCIVPACSNGTPGKVKVSEGEGCGIGKCCGDICCTGGGCIKSVCCAGPSCGVVSPKCCDIDESCVDLVNCCPKDKVCGFGLKGQTKPPSTGYVSVVGGSDFACGIHGSGWLTCWGADESGQASPPGSPFIRVSAGNFHACGVRPDGALECWGSNSDGQAAPP